MACSSVAVANPWLQLPQSAPFVLDQDAAAVESFSLTASAKTRIDTTLLPEPFLGRPDAPVVVLGLNPGWSPEDASWHDHPTFLALSRANLEHAPSPYPFYLLNPAQQSPGRRWWGRRLRALIEGAGLQAVANGVLCVEYFPYHSDGFGSRTPRVPSQDYGFELVRAAIQREATIVVMRSLKRWFAAIPELATYPRKFTLRNVQNVAVSPRNCPDGFDEILREINDAG